MIKKLSIRNKLISIILLVILAAFVIETSIRTWLEIKQTKKEIIAKSVLEAKFIGEYCALPLEFNFPDKAQESIEKVSSLPYIEEVIIFDTLQNKFAHYTTANNIVLPHFHKNDFSSPFFEGNHLHISQPIIYKNKNYGSIYMMVHSKLSQSIYQDLKINALIFIIVVFVSFLLAQYMQKIISTPILDLAKITTQISQDKDYSTRVIKKSYDEIGQLYDEFNHMLQAIEEREKERNLATLEVKKLNQDLEQRVEERTSKLQVALTQLKNMQKDLIESEKMASIGVLTAGLAHEINNPINYISSSIQGMKNAIFDIKLVIDEYEKIKDVDCKKQLKKINKLKEELSFDYLMEGVGKMTGHIQEGVDRTVEIIKSLRLFSRMDIDELQKVDIHSYIDSTLVILHNQYKHSIEIEKRYGNIEELNCVPGKINQVIMNILSNSIQSINNKGKIIISTRSAYNEINGLKTSCLKISIQDTGTGIPEDVIDKIFEPFFTTKKVGEGTGLGLSISYGIIKQHNGIIEVETKKDKGSTFNIYIPYGIKELLKFKY